MMHLSEYVRHDGPLPPILVSKKKVKSIALTGADIARAVAAGPKLVPPSAKHYAQKRI